MMDCMATMWVLYYQPSKPRNDSEEKERKREKEREAEKKEKKE